MPACKVLCIGPLPEPITGQSIAFDCFVKNSNHNIKVLDTNFTGISTLSKVMKTIYSWFYFLYLVIFNKFDALYITTSRSALGFLSDAFFILLFKLISKGRIINHLHGSDFSGFRAHSKLKKIIDYVYGFVDSSIVLCNSMKEQYGIYPNMQLEVVPNFSDVTLSVDEVASKIDLINSNSLSILYLSNLMYSKGILHLVDAVNALLEKGVNITLHIAGSYLDDDKMSASELKKTLEIKLNSNIIYHGVVKGKQKDELLRKSDLFCLPTFYKTEAQPICLIEALSYGLIVLTTDHNYNCDFLSPKIASFFEKNSQEQLEKELNSVFDNLSHYKEKAIVGHEYALNCFNKSKYISSIDQILTIGKI
ncbi:glycosyltransferase family 4 protein [Photobacterium leiognathi subsp. mandapamensis]